MREDFPAAFAFGLLAGWFLGHELREPGITGGDLLGALATVLVGWSIQRSITKQAELARVPIDGIGRLCARVEEGVAHCLAGALQREGQEQQVQRLRLVANDVEHVEQLMRALDLGEDPDLAALENTLFLFKGYLTDPDAIDLTAAGRQATAIRVSTLRIQSKMCRKVLDQPDAGTFLVDRT